MRRCVVLALLIVLTACQPGKPAPSPRAGQPQPNLAADQTLRIQLLEAPRSYDPALQYLSSEEEIGHLYAEPLLRPTPDLADVEGAAAQSYEVSPDGLTYTFHLRPNGQYSDGHPVRAQDFVFAWKRLIDPRVAAAHADFFAQAVSGGEDAAALDPKSDAPRIDPALNALGLKAKDDLTFEVTLPRPEGYFKWIATLWNGAPVRADVIQSRGSGWASKPETLITNGPYRVTAMGQTVTLEANSHYWGGRPPVTAISGVVTGSQEAIRSYGAGDLDIVQVDPAQADQVANARPLGPDLVKTPRLTEHWIDFNVTRAPFDNQKVRQAFAQAVDRAQYIKDVLGGQGDPAGAIIPAGMPGHGQAASNQAFDAATAKGLLAASGEAPSQFDGIQLLVADEPFAKSAAENVRVQLQASLGINLAVTPVDAVTLSDRLRHGDFQIAGPIGWTADYPDPQDWLDLFRSTDYRDYPHWRNQRYDLLVELADETQDAAKRLQAYNQAQQMLLADTPVLLLEQSRAWILKKPYVVGAAPTPLDPGPFLGGLFVTRIYIASH
jgi:oligopeptide transport system substrate-binding protein